MLVTVDPYVGKDGAPTVVVAAYTPDPERHGFVQYDHDGETWRGDNSADPAAMARQRAAILRAYPQAEHSGRWTPGPAGYPGYYLCNIALHSAAYAAAYTTYVEARAAWEREARALLGSVAEQRTHLILGTSDPTDTPSKGAL